MSLVCGHCQPNNVYCYHLTRYLTPEDYPTISHYVDLFERGICSSPSDILSATYSLTSWEVYVLLDFFTSNGTQLRRSPVQKNVIFADSHLVYAESDVPLAPFDSSVVQLLSRWKGRYQYGFFDYGYEASRDQDSQERVELSGRNLLILLHFFAMYGSLARFPDQDT